MNDTTARAAIVAAGFDLIPSGAGFLLSPPATAGWRASPVFYPSIVAAAKSDGRIIAAAAAAIAHGAHTAARNYSRAIAACSDSTLTPAARTAAGRAANRLEAQIVALADELIATLSPAPADIFADVETGHTYGPTEELGVMLGNARMPAGYDTESLDDEAARSVNDAAAHAALAPLAALASPALFIDYADPRGMNYGGAVLYDDATDTQAGIYADDDKGQWTFYAYGPTEEVTEAVADVGAMLDADKARARVALHFLRTAALVALEAAQGAPVDDDDRGMLDGAAVDALAWADDMAARVGLDVAAFRAALIAYLVARDPVETLAAVFADSVAGALGDDFAEMVTRNRNAAPGVCHSHDFIDTNEFMIAALETCGIDWDSEDRTDLMNAAWNAARLIWDAQA